MSKDAPSFSSGRAGPPEGFRLVYEGQPLPPFYAAEMLRAHIGKTVWAMDAGGRTRCGRLAGVPNIREDQTGNVPPVLFEDEKPLYLNDIRWIAVYEGQKLD